MMRNIFPTIPLQQRTIIAFLGGCCFFCASIEYAIPKPLPFLRIGIANIPVMAAIELLPTPAVFFVVLLKILGQALLSGTLFSYVAILSAGGSIASAIVMVILYRLLYKRNFVSWIGLGLSGAIASNCAQLYLAGRCFMGNGIRLFIPAFLVAGTISGIALGVCCSIFFTRSVFFAQLIAGTVEIKPTTCPVISQWNNCTPLSGTSVQTTKKSSVFAGFLCLVLFLVVPTIVEKITLYPYKPFAESICIVLFSVLFIIVNCCYGKKIRLLPYFVTLITVTFAALLLPEGRVLCSIGSFCITSGAASIGLKRAAGIECMIFISRLMITPKIQLPGLLGKLLAGSFNYFGRFSQQRFSKNTFTIATIDRILQRVFFDLE